MNYIRQRNIMAFFVSFLLMMPIGVIGSFLIGVASGTLNEDQGKILWFLYNPALISASFLTFMLIYCQFRQQYASKRCLIAGTLLAFVEAILMQFITVMVLSPWWVVLLGPGSETTAHWMIVSGCAWTLTMLFCGAVFLAYRSFYRQASQ